MNDNGVASKLPNAEDLAALEGQAMEISAQAAILYGHLHRHDTNDAFTLRREARQCATLLVDAIDVVRDKGPINEILVYTAWITEVRPHMHGMSPQFDNEVGEFRDRLDLLLEGEMLGSEDAPAFWRTLLILVSAGVERDYIRAIR